VFGRHEGERLNGLQLSAVLVLACTICACGDRESPPPVRQPKVAGGAPRPGAPAPSDSGYEPNCRITSEADGVAAGLLNMLASADARDAQFALDSLQVIRGETLRFLLCELENDKPIRVRHFLALNRSPHLAPVREFVAHHSAATVGEAIGLVVGAPAKGGGTCGGVTREQRAACAIAWRVYLQDTAKAQ